MSSWNREIVGQIESHWRDQLRPRLAGLTDAEYFWKRVPGCWTLSRRGHSKAPISWGSGDFTWDYGEPGDVEPVTTIAWRLAHLIVGLAETNGRRFGGPEADPRTYAYAGTADEAMRQLDFEFEYWCAGVKALGDAGLMEPQGGASPPEFADAPMVRLISHMNVEVIHHGAEVCLLRDLYARRSAP